MTALRQRFIEDLQLHGFALSTQRVYVAAIKLLARHYRQSPDQLTEEQIRQYFLFLTNERKVSRSHATITLCAIKFLYEQTLQRPWPVFRLARPRREHKIPAVMSRGEVRQLLACFRAPFYRVFFTTVYACGLRVSEGVQLQVSDVDGPRLLLHVRGKGSRDRYVPLPAPVLHMLRRFWKTHRSVPWLFPSPCAKSKIRPVSRERIQRVFNATRPRFGLNKHVTIHTLRHSYATHLLEAGVNLRLIQAVLGHNSPKTTALYTHLTVPACALLDSPIQQLVQDLCP
jgi:site-specific recombinase XerD